MVHLATDCQVMKFLDPERVERMHSALIGNSFNRTIGFVEEFIERVSFCGDGFGTWTDDIDDVVYDAFVSTFRFFSTCCRTLT